MRDFINLVEGLRPCEGLTEGWDSNHPLTPKVHVNPTLATLNGVIENVLRNRKKLALMMRDEGSEIGLYDCLDADDMVVRGTVTPDGVTLVADALLATHDDLHEHDGRRPPCVDFYINDKKQLTPTMYRDRGRQELRRLADQWGMAIVGEKYVAEGFGGAPLPATPENIERAKRFVFKKWVERARERGLSEPKDLSGSCKFTSMFAQAIFGGRLKGNSDHQFVMLGGQIIDLNSDAEDARNLGEDAHAHDPEWFGNDDHLESMRSCEPRVNQWVEEFRSTKIDESASYPLWVKNLRSEREVMIYEDPSYRTIVGLLRRNPDGLRGIATRDHFFVWAAADALHSETMNALRRLGEESASLGGLHCIIVHKDKRVTPRMFDGWAGRGNTTLIGEARVMVNSWGVWSHPAFCRSLRIEPFTGETFNERTYKPKPATREIAESIPPYVEPRVMKNPSALEIAGCFGRSPYIRGKYGTVKGKYPVVRGIQTKDGNVWAGCASQFRHVELMHWARSQGSEYDYSNRAEFIVFADGTMSSRCYWDPDSGKLPFFPRWEKAVARVEKPALVESAYRFRVAKNLGRINFEIFFDRVVEQRPIMLAKSSPDRLDFENMILRGLMDIDGQTLLCDAFLATHATLCDEASRKGFDRRDVLFWIDDQKVLHASPPREYPGKTQAAKDKDAALHSMFEQKAAQWGTKVVYDAR